VGTQNQISNESIKRDIVANLANKINHRKEIYADCPLCGKHAKKDTHFSFNPTKGNYGSYKCFSCGTGGNGYDLAKRMGIFIKREKTARKLPEYKKPEITSEKTSNEKHDVKKQTYPVSNKPQINETRYIVRHPISGKPLFGNSRFVLNTIGKKGKPEKETKQFTYGQNGASWIGYTGARYLYGLNEALTAGADICFIHEGEKTADRLNSDRIGNEYHLSVTRGKLEIIDQVNFEFLRYKIVYLVPDIDADNGGQKCMALNYAILKDAGINVKIIELQNHKFSGYDAEDFINDGHSWRGIEKTTSNKISAAFYEKYGFEHKDGRKIFKSEYVAKRIINIQKKFIAIISGQGTGKTFWAEIQAAIAKEAGDKVLYFAHRVSLVMQAAEKLGIAFYQEEGKTIDGKLSPKSLAVTIDSVHRLHPLAYDGAVIVLDEVDQILRQLIGKTTNDRKREILKNLKFIVKNASRVIFMSADIDEPTIEFICKTLEVNIDEIEFYENEFTRKRKAVKISTPARMLEMISEHIKTGEKIAISCMKREGHYSANFVHKFLKEKFPDKNFLCVTRENSASKEAMEALKNPEYLNKYDAVIYSPTWQSGVDFPLKSFKHCFMFANNRNATTAPDLMQAAGRFRYVETLYHYITPKREYVRGNDENGKVAIIKNKSYFTLETDENKIREKYLKIEKDFREILNYSPEVGWHPYPEYEALFDIAVKCEAYDNESKNNLEKHFTELLSKRGYYRTIDGNDTKASNETREFAGEISSERVEEIKEAVLMAADIDTETYEARQVKGSLSTENFFECQRYEYKQANGGADELEKAVEINLHSFKRGVYNMELLKANESELIERDKKDNQKYIQEKARRIIKARLLKKIENKIGLLSSKSFSETDTAELSEFIKNDRENISSILFAVTDKMIEKPGYFIRAFYAALCLKTTRTGSKGARRRVVDMESLSLINRVLDRREKARGTTSNVIFSGIVYNNKPCGTKKKKTIIQPANLFAVVA